MNAVFADTFFFLALLNERDEAHARALHYEANMAQLVTTAWILTEVADAFSAPENRHAFLRLWDTLRESSDARIIRPTSELFDRGLELFRQRPDKEWSLTDCISFVVMRDEKIADALTGDHHFEQAGFRALLK
jgi:predicted nucleic acid-binding protein